MLHSPAIIHVTLSFSLPSFRTEEVLVFGPLIFVGPKTKSALLIVTMPPAADKFSTLPDTIICFILCKIPIKEAIRSSILSKRWRFLYTQLSQLTLAPHLLLGPVDPDPLSIATVENIISQIMLLHSSDLEVCYISNAVRPHTLLGRDSQWRFTRDNVYKWVRCAELKNVKHLTLCDSPNREIPPLALFSCTRLVTLTLYNYIFSHLPTLFSGFNYLTACTFNCVELTDDTLALFISHCPLLRNLTLDNCVGLRQPAISAPNITDLNVDNGLEVLTVNCPKLNTLKAYLIKDLKVNGLLFHEISYAIWKLKIQCGNSLIALYVDSGLGAKYNFSAEIFLEIVGSFRSLKELVIHIASLLEREKEMAVPLFNLLERLPNLELLHLEGIFLWELARDPIPPALNSPLTNLRKIFVYISGLDESEISVLGCLLQSTPVLEMMEFRLLEEDEYENPEYTYTEFLEKMLCLRRISPKARICKYSWFANILAKDRLQNDLSD